MLVSRGADVNTRRSSLLCSTDLVVSTLRLFFFSIFPSVVGESWCRREHKRARRSDAAYVGGQTKQKQKADGISRQKRYFDIQIV